jgi:hypothetical protein
MLLAHVITLIGQLFVWRLFPKQKPAFCSSLSLRFLPLTCHCSLKTENVCWKVFNFGWTVASESGEYGVKQILLYLYCVYLGSYYTLLEANMKVYFYTPENNWAWNLRFYPVPMKRERQWLATIVESAICLQDKSRIKWCKRIQIV